MTSPDLSATTVIGWVGRRRGWPCRSAALLLAASAALAGCAATPGSSAPLRPDRSASASSTPVAQPSQHVAATTSTQWALSWNSDFGKPGALNKWVFVTGGNGWGLDQLQWYEASNASVDKAGQLVITMDKGSGGQKCWYGACRYTSARMETKTKFSQAYGKFEARIKFPPGVGLWPSFWIEGTNVDQVGWPACGEIDVNEPLMRNPYLVLAYAHAPKVKYKAALTVMQPITAGFHTYEIIWTPKGITWYFDGHAYSHMSSFKGWGFNHQFFMILNLAVGGNYPGPLGKNTQFPAKMYVDWVRVYHQVKSSGAAS